MMYQYTPDEQPLVTVDHIQQQPLIGVWQFVFVCVLVLQVKFGLVEAQTKAGNLQKKRGKRKTAAQHIMSYVQCKTHYLMVRSSLDGSKPYCPDHSL
jgi:hypothetical protein